MASGTGDRQGTDRSAEENDVLVAEYFAMLGDELAGRDYVKAHHRRAVVERLGRSEGSVERKYMNVSAVLMKLGLPRINGYAPAWNAQFGALTLAIERRLTLDGSLLSPVVLPRQPVPDDETFVPAPVLAAREDRRQEPINRLVRKFDPVRRDARNRALGKQGEAFVIEAEERRLHSAGRQDLVRQVRGVADLDGDGAGYDVRSFDPATSAPKLIEVKTTCGDQMTPFFVTRNEEALSREQPEAFRLYRVFDFSARPRIFELLPPLGGTMRMEAETWIASFR